MDDLLTDKYSLIKQSVTDDGKTVTLFVRPVRNDRWLLSILGRDSTLTEWPQSFGCPQEARHFALALILEQGIATFYERQAVCCA